MRQHIIIISVFILVQSVGLTDKIYICTKLQFMAQIRNMFIRTNIMARRLDMGHLIEKPNRYPIFLKTTPILTSVF